MPQSGDLDTEETLVAPHRKWEFLLVTVVLNFDDEDKYQNFMYKFRIQIYHALLYFLRCRQQH